MPGNVKWLRAGHSSFPFSLPDLERPECSAYSCFLSPVPVRRALCVRTCSSQYETAVRNMQTAVTDGNQTSVEHAITYTDIALQCCTSETSNVLNQCCLN